MLGLLLLLVHTALLQVHTGMYSSIYVLSTYMHPALSARISLHASFQKRHGPLCHGPYGLWSMAVPGAVLHIVQITLGLNCVTI